MKITSCKVAFLTVLGACAVCLVPGHCFAQKDPEAAARQAQIDADLAQSKIENLEREQVGAAAVESESSTEMLARQRQIDQLESEEVRAERRRIEADKAE